MKTETQTLKDALEEIVTDVTNLFHSRDLQPIQQTISRAQGLLDSLNDGGVE